MLSVYDKLTRGYTIFSTDVDQVVEDILSCNSEVYWSKNEEIALGRVSWRPNAVSIDGSRLLYVAGSIGLPPYVKERLRLAVENGVRPVIALTIRSLRQHDVIALLLELDSDVVILDSRIDGSLLKACSVFEAVVDNNLLVPGEVRRCVVEIVWDLLRSGSPQAKGARLEGVLAFVFSQIPELSVTDSNYRNETEEIDLVLQVRDSGSGIGLLAEKPLLLVEAKNRKEKADQQVISVLMSKLETKRDSAKIGIVVSLSGFTADARNHELRYSASHQGRCVVMIDDMQLKALFVEDDLSRAFETLLREALIR